MSIDELLQQMEDYHRRREQRDHRPQWLRTFISEAAELLDPLSGVGRVGYECSFDERGWIVRLFLGTTEIIGGPMDGKVEPTNFRVDLQQLTELFFELDRVEWYCVAGETDSRGEADLRSLLSVRGMLDRGTELTLELLAAPPGSLPPGLRKPATDEEPEIPPKTPQIPDAD